MSSSLSALLDKEPPTSPTRASAEKSVNAHTVAGDRNVASENDEGDIIIRPDGKKVRKVKRAKSGAYISKEDGEVYRRSDGKLVRKVAALSPGKSPSKSPSSSASLGGDAAENDSTVYRRADGKLVRRVKASDLAAAGVELPSTGKPTDGEGEVYRNAEGKLVRKKVVRRKSYGGVGLKPTKESGGDSTTGKGDLAKLLDGNADSSTANQKGSSKSVGAPTRQRRASVGTGLSSAASVGGGGIGGDSGEGEVYRRADGKMVRRVVVRRKSEAGGLSSSSTAAEDKEEKAAAEKEDSQGNKKEDESSATTATTDSSKTESEEPKSPTRKAPARKKSGVGRALSGLLGLGGKKKGGKSDDSAAAATVAVDGRDSKRNDKTKPESAPSRSVPARSTSNSSATSTTSAASNASDVYRRADGKLVRRVVKPTSSATASLGGFMDNADKNKPKGSSGGAATVAGDRPTASSSLEVSGEKPQGDVYRRADGKLVRRVLKPATTPAEAQDDVYRRADGKLVRRVAQPAESPAAAEAKDDVYRRPDGKLVRKVKRHKSGAYISKVDGEVYRRSDGKLVRRVQNSGAEETNPIAAMATLSNTSASNSDNDGESEVYRRADGKLVRRVRRSTSSSSLSSKDSTAGESVSSDAASVTDEVKPVRQADGRLVRMVKRFVKRGSSKKEEKKGPVSHLSPADEEIAQQYRKMREMGMPDDAVKHKMTQDDVNDAIQQSVLNHEVAPVMGEPGSEKFAPVVELTPGEEAEAAQFRKMLKMGLPPEVVRQKMEAAQVDSKIVFALTGGDAPKAIDTPKTGETAAGTQSNGVSLTDKEEETASRFRKMLTIGLSEEAVRHKMMAEGVDARIINAVTGEDSPTNAAAGGDSPTSAGGLSMKEEEIVERYRKMLRSGIPEIAVRNKMASEALEERLQEMVLQQGATVEFNTAQKLIKKYEDIAKKFKEMLNSGESLEIVRRKMKEEGHNEKLITAVLEGGSLEDLAKEEAKESSKGEVKETASPLFEVEIQSSTAPAAPAPTAPSGLDPSKQYTEIGEGKEVVDSKLADAARAVSALGDLDMKALLDKLQNGDMEILLNKLKEAEKRQKKLEKQLAQAGIGVAEDIEYTEAKVKVEEIAKRMGEIGGSDATVENKEDQTKLREEYFKLEQEMERYNTALMLTDEFQQEQDAVELKWENDNAPLNLEALKKIRRHMPVKIRFMSEADLTTKPSPNGKVLPKEIAKKFKRTNVLQCLRVDPSDMERMHPSTLENMRVTGLTLTERRALYAHLKPLGPKWEKNKSEKMTERKLAWYNMMKNNFKENLAPYQRHVDEFGPPGRHSCTLIGKQCPVRADKIIDYDGNYGWPEGPSFEVSEVKKAAVDDPGAKAKQEAIEMLREKKANERGDKLKKHYKGKLLQVSKANGSCESMDEAMDRMENHTMRWMQTVLDKGGNLGEAEKKKEVASFMDAINEMKLATLDFAQRSGMQLTGKKKAGGDAADIRSSVEGGLAEEVIECSVEFFGYIRQRMREGSIIDSRLNSTMEAIEGILNELHDKNLQLLRKLGEPRPPRSRKLKKNSDLKSEVLEKKKQQEEKDKPAEEAPPRPGPPGGGGRGGLLGRFQLLTILCTVAVRAHLIFNLFVSDAIQKGPGRGGARGGGGRGGLLGKQSSLL